MEEPQQFTSDEEALAQLTAQLSEFNWKDGVVDRAKRLLYSDDLQDNIKGVVSLKAMLSIGREEVYELAQEVIDSGVISRLVAFLSVDNRELQWPAAFCLTNVAAGFDTQTQTVVEAGAIDPLIGFLRHSDAQLRRQAVFCLANVAGSTPGYRVLLARHPDFFPAMFAAAALTSDSKVLELICWNLRNVCLLGGPTFDEIKPGVLFLLEKVLRRHWSFQHSCSRFALETVCSVCHTPEGRAAMQQADLLRCLLTMLKLSPANAISTTQWATEALAWLIAYGSPEDRENLVRNSDFTSFLIEREIAGQYGSAVQEFGLKIIACLVLDTGIPGTNTTDFNFGGGCRSPAPQQTSMPFSRGVANRFIRQLQQHPDLLQITGQLSMGIVEGGLLCDPGRVGVSAGNGSEIGMNNGSGMNAAQHQTTIRECAAFIFSSCVLASSAIPAILMRLLVSGDAVPILLAIVDFSTELICLKRQQQLGFGPSPSEGPPGQGVANGVAGSVTGLGSGPSFPNMAEEACLQAVKALCEHLHQGSSIQQSNNLPENPVARFCANHDASTRLSMAIQNASLPCCALEPAKTFLSDLSKIIASTRGQGTVFGFQG